MFEQICNQYLSDLCNDGTFIDADLIGVKEDAEISKAIVTVSLNNNIYERQIIIKKVNNELTWNFVNPIDENELNYTEGDWNYPNYQKRIIAPLELIMDDNGIKMYGWFQLNNLPVKTIGNNVYLYCNVILPQHQVLIDSFGELIIVEDISNYQ